MSRGAERSSLNQRKDCTALGPRSEGISSAASPPHFFFFVPVLHALRVPLALCSPLILSLDGSNGLPHSFPTKIERAISHRDVDLFSAPNEIGNFEPPIYTFFWALHLFESKPSPARVVPTTSGEYLSIRSRAVTGSPITPKANFNSPNQSSSRVMIVDSYKDIDRPKPIMLVTTPTGARKSSPFEFLANVPRGRARHSRATPRSRFPTGRRTGDSYLKAHHDLQATSARPGKATRLGVRGSIVLAVSRTSYSLFLKAGGRDLFSTIGKKQSRFDSAQPNDTSNTNDLCLECVARSLF
ncbi:hypothetical protein M9H77_23682 [Catharanthus roseus]|uniref:Uncharacterized protein n=1 Tax=Catharanthus roseus TaxID=4058 RepID=A0ACC0ATY5_CATRO|nr:hypothetical protein M9H77_23682 [Catharanthus roseus]